MLMNLSTGVAMIDTLQH